MLTRYESLVQLVVYNLLVDIADPHSEQLLGKTARALNPAEYEDFPHDEDAGMYCALLAMDPADEEALWQRVNA